ncbi:tumor necrosis factor ligand superfamily member 8 [Hemicordylus capensis]|uniref:tumor necrosis factor ligand superfamily member 8 n=1 Tax=Hemicordylus capensis TaxID=884348 RepID=UPI002302E8AD|nr:tumor necrosis factor ligand superfamily member 8 [Hemicordylus capensis]
MSSQPEQKCLWQVDGRNQAATNMTEESVPRQFHGPIQTYFYFVIISLTVCLIAALGTILVLVLQRTGSAAQYDGPPGAEKQALSEEGVKNPQSMTSEAAATYLKKWAQSHLPDPACEKAAAYLEVSPPVNQSQLSWIKSNMLYNMRYEKGNLIVQKPGLYFIYCHLHFFVAKCDTNHTPQKLELRVNGSPVKETLHTLCSPEAAASKGKFHSLFQVLLMDLRKEDQITVEIEPFKYLEVDRLARNNVLGVIKYIGEEC